MISLIVIVSIIKKSVTFVVINSIFFFYLEAPCMIASHATTQRSLGKVLTILDSKPIITDISVDMIFFFSFLSRVDMNFYFSLQTTDFVWHRLTDLEELANQTSTAGYLRIIKKKNKSSKPFRNQAINYWFIYFD